MTNDKLSAYEIAKATLAYYASGSEGPAPENINIKEAARLAKGSNLSETTAKQLHSVFDAVKIKEEIDGKSVEHVAFQANPLPLGELKLGDELFPGKPDSSTADALKKALKKASDVTGQPDNVAIENLLGALQRYGWRLPAPGYGDKTDISLYDHARVTAAIAASLNSETQASEALLIGGDISGIQDFIYTISSKNAAKSLRGRSFYLQILTEAVLRFVLRELDLPYSNVLYSGGGHFFLLAPASAKSRLTDIQKEISERLLHHHGTALYLALGYATVSEGDFTNGEALSARWGDMHQNLTLAKRKRYFELGNEIHAKVFGVQGDPNNTCAVCGDDRRSPIKGGDIDDDTSERFEICPLCNSFGELGTDLTQSEYLALGHLAEPVFNPTTDPNDYAAALASFGITLTMQLKSGIATTLGDNLTHATLWALGDPGKWPTTGRTPASHLVRYVVNRVPPMTFDKLQDKVEGGFKRLGVLRMDVDHLGQIFSKGLIGNYTLTRIATLSAAMSLFFEGHIKHLLGEEEKNNKYKNVYAVYAGGDDLFLIGPWTDMPELAIKITDDFASYTGGHPGLHASGGLAFIGGKYPVYQAAADAGKAEDQAKDAGRNRFSFLDVPWTWTEFEKLRDDHNKLIELVEKHKGPNAIFQTLQMLAVLQVEGAKNGKPEWGPWQWRGAYQFTRMIEKEKKEEVKRGLESIYDRLKDDFKTIPHWGKAARWAQLEARKERE